MSNNQISEATRLLKEEEWGKVPHQNTNDRFEIDRAMQFFYERETHCDDLIQEQDDLIRRVARRPRDQQLGADLIKRAEQSERQLASGEAGDRVTAVWAKDLSPLISNDFAAAATYQEIEDIERLEFDIQSARQMMGAVERMITSHVPRTPKEMILKLKFMAGLAMDGGEVEMEALARLADDVASSLLLGFDEFTPQSQV